MIIARDLMSSKPRFLHTSTKLADALQLFETKQFRTLPVLNREGSILGILSEMSLLRCLIISKTKGTADLPLNDFVSLLTPPVFVEDKDPVDKVVLAMTKSPQNRVLVVDSNGHLAGVISPKDVILYLVNDGSGSLQEKVESLEAEVTGLREQHEDLMNQKKHAEEFESLLQGSLFLFHSLEPTGKIRFANARLHEVLGYQNGELIGKSLTDLYPEHLHEAVTQGLSSVQAQGKHDLTYSAFRTKKGEIIKVEMTSVALKDKSGKFSGTATVSRIIDADVMLKLLSGAFKHDDSNS